MNGYGHFLPRVRAFQAYWGAASVLLLVLALLFWSRGTASSWRERLAAAKERLERADDRRRRGWRCSRSPALGGFIFYNTNVLNRYETTARLEQALQAEYEKRYKPMAAEPQPKIDAVDAGRRPLPARAAGADEGPLRAREQVRPAGQPAAAGVRPGREARGAPARPRRAGQAREGRRRARRAHLPARPAAARRARRPTLAFDLELPTHGFTQRRRRTPPSSTTARFVNGQRDAADDRLPGARRARARPATARSSASRPRSGCATATIRPASRRTCCSATPTSSPSRRRCRPSPTRSRSRPATCSASGPRTGGATSTTRWTRRSSTSSPSSRRATR